MSASRCVSRARSGSSGSRRRRGRAQQRRGIAPAPEVEGHLRAHALKLGAAELVERPGVGGRQQRLGGQEVGGLELGAGGGQGPRGPLPGVGGERDRPVQERGGGGDAAAALGARRRIQQLLGHVVVGGAWPRAPDARRAGRDRCTGSVAAASAPWAARRCAGDAAR